MKEKTFLFYTLVAGLVYIAYNMFLPFMPAICWAVIFSIVLYPVYESIRVKIKSSSIAAAVMVIISFLLFIGPLTYVTYLLAMEIKAVIAHLNERGMTAMFFGNANIKDMLASIARLLDVPVDSIYDILRGLAESIEKSLMRLFQEHALGAVHAFVDYFMMLFTIFFLLRDGQIFIARIYRLLPLPDEQKNRLFLRIREVIVSTIYGGVMIALAHGIIGGSAFYFLGVPSPILLGFAMSVFSFIPVLGDFTVWGPVTVYLFLTGSFIKGVIMAVIAIVFLVGIIDHILRPKVIGQRAKIHTVLIFFGVLGGIHLFGLIGFVAGPLVIALLLMVMESIEQRMEQ
ncbi:MAG: AI-2E family transporter [Dissulfurispiraceae bacterium]